MKLKKKKKKLGGIDFLLFPANPTIFLYPADLVIMGTIKPRSAGGAPHFNIHI